MSHSKVLGKRKREAASGSSSSAKIRSQPAATLERRRTHEQEPRLSDPEVVQYIKRMKMRFRAPQDADDKYLAEFKEKWKELLSHGSSQQKEHSLWSKLRSPQESSSAQNRPHTRSQARGSDGELGLEDLMSGAESASVSAEAKERAPLPRVQELVWQQVKKDAERL
jgi:hypothetical protein